MRRRGRIVTGIVGPSIIRQEGCIARKPLQIGGISAKLDSMEPGEIACCAHHRNWRRRAMDAEGADSPK